MSFSPKALGAKALFVYPILFRIPLPGGSQLPIYSYGVMLGLSFIVGWYLTLGLAERERLPKETMANCYVVTALSAVVFARLLYVVTNLHEFQSFGDVFNVRTGGMVAYGGFLGGFVGSFVFLRLKGIPLIPWADVAVPSLASGLLITRVGCYLYGCDFGQPLSDAAPAWLKRLGSFPKWAEGTLEDGSGSPAWAQHVRERGLSIDAASSLPVHPTQLYEALIGLALLVLLLSLRKSQRFRGQIFLTFTFLYGAARFGLELLRDDLERGNIPPALPPHVLFPLSLAAFGAAFAFGYGPSIKAAGARRALSVAVFVPALWAFFRMQPDAFAQVVPVQLSTSQFIGLVTAIAAAAGFAMLARAAEQNPKAAMALPDFSHLEPREGEPEAEPTPEPNTKPKTKATHKARPEEPDAESEGDAEASSEDRSKEHEGVEDDEAPKPEADRTPAAPPLERPAARATKKSTGKKSKKTRGQ